ncbi:MAG TPA: A/G-specific adenine glycosylase [Candidatus Acidoferrales bacterium]|nr:A/G-specific adenine glycosylase [Candidatus Acidoferrales bacterium]
MRQCPRISGHSVKLKQRQIVAIRRALLSWYRANRRALPWRKGRDPYRIWVAEIMLQQTRIAAVIPYYVRFLRRFPTVKSLARARESEVLKYWAGLGYYSRARNLHRAAREIVRDHGAIFPNSLEEALALPGIGGYTAAAILSIAYGVPLAALDGNVARVLARLLAIRGDVYQPRQRKLLGETAQQLIPLRSAGDWNQAMMELGETICTPRAPNCNVCPLARRCRAFALGLTEKIPSPSRKPVTVPMSIAAAILLDPRGRTLLTKSPGCHDAVLFSRMWQFPAIEVRDHLNAPETLARHLRATLRITSNHFAALPHASHAVTFRKLTLLPFLVRVPKLPRRADYRSLPLAKLAEIAVSSATRKIARAARSVQAQ